MRKSNIECLRIIAMLFIVLSHWGGHGSWTFENSTNLLHGGFIEYTQFLGEVGNCIFILITGYFLSERNEIRWSGIKNVVIDIKFYALLLWLLLLISGITVFSFGKMLLALFPIIYNQYWFVWPYIITLLVSPIINRYVSESSVRSLKWFYLSFILVEVVLPMLKAPTISSNTGLFILYYSVGVIIKSEKLPLKLSNSTKYLLLSIGLLPYIIILANDKLFIDKNFPSVIFDSRWWRFSPFPLITGIGLVQLFSSFNMNNAFVNKLAKSVFAVYIISENPNVYNWLWRIDYLDNNTFIGSPFFILISLIQCISIMAICIMIDMSYKRIRALINI